MSDHSERFEKAELTEAEVITALRLVYESQGEPSSCEALMNFVKQREAQANKENTDRGNIEAAIQMARIYANSGYLEAAYDELDSIREAAANGHDDLLEQIDGFMDKIDARLAAEQNPAPSEE
jgi:hypothetical protein